MEEPHKNGIDGDLRNFETYLNTDLLEQIFQELLAMPPRDSITNQMLAIEKFEMFTKIQKNDGSEIPISLVTMKRTRDYVTDSEWERTLKIIMKLKLHNATGLNILELLDLPRYQLRLIIDTAAILAREEPSVMADMEKRAKEAAVSSAKAQTKKIMGS